MAELDISAMDSEIQRWSVSQRPLYTAAYLFFSPPYLSNGRAITMDVHHLSVLRSSRMYCCG